MSSTSLFGVLIWLFLWQHGYNAYYLCQCNVSDEATIICCYIFRLCCSRLGDNHDWKLFPPPRPCKRAVDQSMYGKPVDNNFPDVHLDGDNDNFVEISVSSAPHAGGKLSQPRVSYHTGILPSTLNLHPTNTKRLRSSFRNVTQSRDLPYQKQQLKKNLLSRFGNKGSMAQALRGLAEEIEATSTTEKIRRIPFVTKLAKQSRLTKQHKLLSKVTSGTTVFAVRERSKKHKLLSEVTSGTAVFAVRESNRKQEFSKKHSRITNKEEPHTNLEKLTVARAKSILTTEESPLATRSAYRSHRTSEKRLRSTKKLQNNANEKLKYAKVSHWTREYETRTTRTRPRTTTKPHRSTEKKPKTIKKPSRTTEKLFRSTERPASTKDKLLKNAEWPASTKEKLFRSTQRPASTTDKPHRAKKKPLRTTEEPPTTTEELPTTTEEPPTTTEEPPTTSEESNTSTDEIPTTKVKQLKFTAKPYRTMANSFETTEEPLDTTEESPDTTDEQSETTEEPLETTEELLETTEEQPDTTEEPSTNTEKSPTPTDKAHITKEKLLRTSGTRHRTTKHPPITTKHPPTITEPPDTTTEVPSRTTAKTYWSSRGRFRFTEAPPRTTKKLPWNTKEPITAEPLSVKEIVTTEPPAGIADDDDDEKVNALETTTGKSKMVAEVTKSSRPVVTLQSFVEVQDDDEDANEVNDLKKIFVKQTKSDKTEEPSLTTEISGFDDDDDDYDSTTSPDTTIMNEETDDDMDEDKWDGGPPTESSLESDDQLFEATTKLQQKWASRRAENLDQDDETLDSMTTVSRSPLGMAMATMPALRLGKKEITPVPTKGVLHIRYLDQNSSYVYSRSVKPKPPFRESPRPTTATPFWLVVTDKYGKTTSSYRAHSEPVADRDKRVSPFTIDHRFSKSTEPKDYSFKTGGKKLSSTTLKSSKNQTTGRDSRYKIVIKLPL